MAKNRSQQTAKRSFDPMVALGARLAIIRSEQRLTQAEFARAIGVSAAAYNAYERGSRGIPVTAVMKIGELYGTNLNWLLRDDGPPLRDTEISEMEKFTTSLLSYIEQSGIRIRAERQNAIISKWCDELRRGRIVPAGDVLIWIDLLGD